MEQALLIFCLAMIGCVLVGNASEKLADFWEKFAKFVGQVTATIALLMVVVIVVSPLVLGPKRTAQAGDSLARLTRQVIAAVHAPGR